MAGSKHADPLSGELMEKSAGMHRPPNQNRKTKKGRIKRPFPADDDAIAR
jgi:hypothetical protein